MRSDAATDVHGASIPLVGIGTWPLRGRECADIVEGALRIGYRHIDTAELYENECEVGEGLRRSGIPRDAVSLTSKIMPAHFAPDELERAAKNILTRLRVSDVDLLLLRWPSTLIPLSETVGAVPPVVTNNVPVENVNEAEVEYAHVAAALVVTERVTWLVPAGRLMSGPWIVTVGGVGVEPPPEELPPPTPPPPRWIPAACSW
jgi:aryl-alcohol dehydrogenase-like predicted oxidoreductase